MIPARFGYQRVSTIDEALALSAQDSEAKYLAGGHSLIPLMKLRLAQPSRLVDVSRIAELRTIVYEPECLSLGAAVRYFEVLGDRRMMEVLPLMSEAVSVIADPQVRHRGTIGGSAVHADPTSDLAAVFLAAEARFRVRGPGGERVIPAHQWYVAPLISALEPREILLTVEFGRPLPAHQAYVKFPHPASGYALAGAAALIDQDGQGRVTKARIAVTGAGAMPFRAGSAEEVLLGRPLDSGLIAEAADAGAGDGEYEGDPQFPEDYRRNLARVMMNRALSKLAPL